ncbi:unnamed protein product [Peniophora sp. CBMAI 1063]|nr:unnamed protein product [Peniophora sp. CBMAI 1063]
MRSIATETQLTVEEVHSSIAKSWRVAMSELKAMKEELDLFLEHDRQRSTADSTLRLLGMLDRVASADMDAQNSNGCLEGTRVDLLRDLMLWVRDSRSPRILWLNGMAGTGKSAIARSFSRNLRSEGLLGGTFFCYRMTADQADVRRIIPTIAVSLALRDIHCTETLLAELDADSSFREWDLETQIERLLCKTFAGIEHDANPMPIVVIDALDECSDQSVTRDLLSRLIECVDRLPVKFFLTSRPEPHIQETLESMHPDVGKVVRLHDIEHAVVRSDISRFITHSLASMRSPSFRMDWPPRAQVDTLTRLYGSVFLHASRAVTYIERDPVERLARLTVTPDPGGHVATRSLDDMYNLILFDATTPDENEVEDIGVTPLRVASHCQPLTAAAPGVAVEGMNTFQEDATHEVRMARASSLGSSIPLREVSSVSQPEPLPSPATLSAPATGAVRIQWLHRLCGNLTHYETLNRAQHSNGIGAFRDIHDKLISDWHSMRIILLAISACDITVYGFSSQTDFTVDKTTKRCLVVSAVSAGIGIMATSTLLSQYSGMDTRAFVLRARGRRRGGDYMLFAIASMLPRWSTFLASTSLALFIIITAYSTWPAAVLVLCILAVLLWCLQFI